MAQRYRKKTYRVRYDRIICVLAILVVLIFMLVSCVGSCTNKDGNGDGNDNSVVDGMTSTDPNATDEAGNPISTTPAATEPNITYATTSMDAQDVHKGHLILVNDENKCTFDHTAIAEGTSKDVDFVTIQSILGTKEGGLHYTAKDWEVGLDKEAAYAMDAWLEGFYAASGNADVRMIGGYRGDSEDPEFHAGRTCTLGIFPDDSGSYVYKNEGTFSWIAEHAHEYGFVLRYPESKASYFSENTTDRKSGTFRYVGVAAATYMVENDLCLEEYLNSVKMYTIDSMLEITTDSAKYGVYYVPVNSNGATSFSVPAGNTPYSVSGNNMDGFVVTVMLSGTSSVTMPTEAETTEAAEDTTAAAE